MTSSIRPYSTASSAVRILSRSMSLRTCSSVRPVCSASMLLELRAHPQDLVGLDLDVAAPGRRPRCTAGGSGSARCGSAKRLPGVPAASSTAAAEAAWPMQIVWMSGRTNCIVS